MGIELLLRSCEAMVEISLETTATKLKVNSLRSFIDLEGAKGMLISIPLVDMACMQLQHMQPLWDSHFYISVMLPKVT